MKPDGEMHAGAEEVELEPSDFFIDIATLIIEGRVPGLTEKGFGEGPHCRPVHGQNRHICEAGSPDCQQYEQLEKHMLLLWKNGIPMSIEVLLYPDCCQPVGTKVQVETSSVPETSSCILLEQWTLHMPQRRTPDALIVPKGLLQAVRSFLHFSQLSAWLSLGKGKIKTNIHYRVCVPGEAFSTKFERNPDIHKFPVANVGRSHALKVTIKSLPRQGEFPKVPCLKHGVDLVQSPIASAFLESNSKGNENSETGAVKPRLSHSVRPQNFEGSHFPSGSSFDPPRDKYSKKSLLQYPDTNSKNQYEMPSPATETSLGECLLDPPQSLLSYPKRYQSPSRCGSPSVEVPEHLMFGLGATANSTKAEAHIPAYLHPTPKAVISQPPHSMRDRSRPQRRPVVERFLKKDIYGVASPSKPLKIDCDRLKQIDQTKKHLKDMRKTPGGMVEDGFTKNNISPHYPGKYPPQDLLPNGPLAKEEMKMVLDSLKHRYLPSQVTLMSQFEESRPNLETPLISQSYLFNSVKCKKIPPESDCDKRETWKLKEESCDEQMEWTSSLSKDNQWFSRGHILPGSEKCNKLTLSSPEDFVRSPLTPISSVEPRESSKIPSSPYQNHSISTRANIDHFKDQESPVKMTNSELSLKSCTISENILNGKCTVSTPPIPEFIVDQRQNHNEKSLPEPQPSKESGEATRELLLNNSQSINASQRILGRNFASLYFKMLKSNLNLPIQDDKSDEKPDKNGHLIPSAAEKLKFRRSLDSATSMVFHQNTGLPLTSSPAPIRKSGTCFDFDSSLTSVAAIKKALFEKDPELDEETKRLISSSAPASTTTSNLLGNFEESVLNGRLEPVSTVEGFTAEIGASGSFCPRHKTLPVTVFFYTLHDIHNKVTSPYLGHINLGRRGYNIPKKGTVQVTLFNPHRTVVKMFVVRYDLSDMPPCSQTFLRQRTLYMPTGSSEDDDEARKWLRYLIHLRFASSKSGKIYLHTDIRMIVFRKSDLDAATVHGQSPYELRSFTQGPKNPKFSPCK